MRALMFRDRRQAGQVLARHLLNYAGRPDVIVLALPRGGVPVGFEVARALGVPLDVFVVRKLGVPGYPELAMGAIASGGARVLSRELIARLGIPHQALDAVVERETAELARRERLYRGERPPHDLSGKTVIVVDDGLATGSTMRAAVLSARAMAASRVVVAVPVGAAATCVDLGGVADAVACLRTPDPFRAVGAWYEDFAQTTDEEVRELLNPSSGR